MRSEADGIGMAASNEVRGRAVARVRPGGET